MRCWSCRSVPARAETIPQRRLLVPDRSVEPVLYPDGEIVSRVNFFHQLRHNAFAQYTNGRAVFVGGQCRMVASGSIYALREQIYRPESQRQ